MHEKDRQDETFNQDQQEMFQHPDTSLGETRPPRTPGETNLPAIPPAPSKGDDGKPADSAAGGTLNQPDLI